MSIRAACGFSRAHLIGIGYKKLMIERDRSDRYHGNGGREFECLKNTGDQGLISGTINK
jgi:hypothetical protein